jgi:rSAM/selenodomain-associated transferase 2
LTSLSVVIPTWCEKATIAEAVRRAREVGDEVIVADAASPDGTARLAEAAGARVVITGKGRGAQLHAGASAARGDALLFLHADATLDPAGRARIDEALADPAVVGGNFYLRFDPPSFAARLFTQANHARRRWMGIYYGDSALFVRRATYETLGGFRPLPILEDYELVRRLERVGRTVYVRDVEVVASARRFERAPIRTLLLWTALQALYMIGVPPRRLARFYADARPSP